jgi:hypothetical protein
MVLVGRVSRTFVNLALMEPLEKAVLFVEIHIRIETGTVCLQLKIPDINPAMF